MVQNDNRPRFANLRESKNYASSMIIDAPKHILLMLKVWRHRKRHPLAELYGNTLRFCDYTTARQIAPSIQGEHEVVSHSILTLDFAFGSNQWYAFLDVLERLHFDLYTLFSLHKGDVFYLTHGCPSRLEELLGSDPLPEKKRGQPLRNKMLKRKLREKGQLHLRVYRATPSDPDHILLTAHIDPPNIRQHINPIAQIRGHVHSDYVEGERLLRALGNFLNKIMTK